MTLPKRIVLATVLGILLVYFFFSVQEKIHIPQTKEKNRVLFGILSDIHGNEKNTDYFVQQFMQQRVDAFLLPGDVVDHFRNNVPDEKELEDILTRVSAPGLPVYLIPGNHEKKEIYYAVLKRMNKKNIIDMTTTRHADLRQVSILSLPGYNIEGFVAEGGFLFGQEEWATLRKIAVTPKKKILLSHQIPRSTLIDVIFSGNHVGDEKLAQLMKEESIDISVSAHIHEAGGLAETRNGLFVPEKTYSETLYLNPGSVAGWHYLNKTAYTGMAALLTINGTHAMYELIVIK